MPEVKVGKLSTEHPNIREGYEYTGVCACGYFSMGWPTKKQAKLRMDAHTLEHETGELMPDKSEVEALTPDKFAGPTVDDADRSPLWDEVK